jgi:hypothetical protein
MPCPIGRKRSRWALCFVIAIISDEESERIVLQYRGLKEMALEEVKPETAQIIIAHAKARGLSVDEYLRSLLPESKNGEVKPLYETASPDELAEALLDWVKSHDPNTPVILDTRREDLYDDDGR